MTGALHARALATLTLATLVAGCGLKGDLYLDQDPAPAGDPLAPVSDVTETATVPETPTATAPPDDPDATASADDEPQTNTPQTQQ